MATRRRMLGRSPITHYVTLEGLELLTGVDPKDFDLLIVKELRKVNDPNNNEVED